MECRKACFPRHRSRRYYRRCHRKTCLSDASDAVFPYDRRCRSISLIRWETLSRLTIFEREFVTIFKMPAGGNRRLCILQLPTGVMLVLAAIQRRRKEREQQIVGSKHQFWIAFSSWVHFSANLHCQMTKSCQLVCISQLQLWRISPLGSPLGICTFFSF